MSLLRIQALRPPCGVAFRPRLGGRKRAREKLERAFQAKTEARAEALRLKNTCLEN